jgi:hypothetical protein
VSDHDPFWEPQQDIEAAKQPWTWPRAFAVVGKGIVFWLAVVAIVYVAVRYG